MKYNTIFIFGIGVHDVFIDILAIARPLQYIIYVICFHSHSEMKLNINSNYIIYIPFTSI